MNGPIPEVQLEGGPATGSSSLVTESTPVESATMINSNGDTLVPNRPIPTLNKAIMPQIATSAKDEFLKVLCTDQPLWVKSSTDPTFSLQRDHYEMLFPRSTDLFPNSNSLAEASKASRTVKRKAMELVDLFLDTEKWSNLFPTIVREADTIQVIAKGSEENRSGTLLLMHAEMHVLSPLVQSREFCFLRYCEELEAGTWVIVDVSIDYKKEGMAFPPCTWRLPSGCMIQEISNGSSQVSWLEHVEVDAKIKAHQLYRDLVNRGIAFGAERWLMELERMCERFTSAEIDYIPTNDTGAVVAATGGRRSMMKLSHKVVKSFFGILNMSNKMEFPQHLADENSNIRISVRKNADPSRPNAMMIITAATSFRLPLPPQTLFDFFRDTTKRSKAINLNKPLGCSFLCKSRAGACTYLHWNSSKPLYINHSVNVADLQKSVNGIDSPTVPVIPSGVLISKDEESIANEGTNADKGITRGSLLTLAFQILMDNPATMNLESVTSVNSLIASVVGSIKVALLNGPNLEV
ncbi:hypothetical protein RJT34_14492 [Clitoria ternatea]|uniref:START domain-containing protein n=1 Tax=Clitoria ternatea TaxID=43366 RepID=A0AAN9JQV0_CLITE